MNGVLQNVLESAGFRTETTHDRKVLEAARLFADGTSGRSHTAFAALKEAFTQSDFPTLMGDAFERESRAVYAQVNDETTLIARPEGMVDLRPKRLIEVWGDTYFEKVKEGENYKSDNPFKETQYDIRVEKMGRNYGLTFERWLTGDFSSLADFPGILGRGAANTRNREVLRQLVNGNGGMNGQFFGRTINAGLGYNSLLEALEYMRTAENYRGDDLVDAGDPILVVVPALQDTAEALTGVRTIRETVEEDGVRREIERSNRLASITPVVSKEFSKLVASSNRSTAWALLPRATSDNPSLVRTYLRGYEGVDILVKRDQGERVGGGAPGFQEGSFDNDTIWYRGRYFVGGNKAFTQGTTGSTGSGS